MSRPLILKLTLYNPNLTTGDYVWVVLGPGTEMYNHTPGAPYTEISLDHERSINVKETCEEIINMIWKSASLHH